MTSLSRYRFCHSYRSGVGGWTAGEEHEFTAEMAAWILVDSPGAIELVTPEPPPEPDKRALDAPPSDRMVRKSEHRRDRSGG